MKGLRDRHTTRPPPDFAHSVALDVKTANGVTNLPVRPPNCADLRFSIRHGKKVLAEARVSKGLIETFQKSFDDAHRCGSDQ